MKQFMSWSALLIVGAVSSGAEPEIIRMTIHPAKVAPEALKYQLLPQIGDKTSGNAAFGYARAGLMWLREAQDRKFDHKIHEYRLKPLNELPREQLAWLLESPSLKEVDIAARQDYCDWEIRERLRRDGFDLPFPDFQTMRQLVSLLAIRARLEILEGHFDKAVRTLQTGLAFGTDIGAAPLLLWSLTGIAIDRIFLEGLEELLQNPKAPNLYWSLARIPQPLVNIGKTIEGEKLGIEVLFSKPSSVAIAFFYKEGFQELQDEMFKYSSLPYWQARSHVKRLSQQLREKEESGTGALAKTSWIPNLDKVMLSNATLDRRIAALRCIEALRLYAADHEGKLPAALKDITEVPIPIDPVTGKDFEYRSEGNKASLKGLPPEGEEAGAGNTLQYEIALER